MFYQQNMIGTGSAAKRKLLLTADTLLRCTLGPLNISAIRTTKLQQHAANAWKWENQDEASLKEKWSASSNANLLMASFLSGEERIRARMSMGHEYTAITEAMALGEVRGSLESYDATHIQKNQIYLEIDRILYNSTQPFTSSVVIDNNTKDETLNNATHKTEQIWQHYLDTSEQGQMSRILLMHQKEDQKENQLEWSGGIMLQSLGRSGMATNEKEKETINGMSNGEYDSIMMNEFSQWWDENNNHIRTVLMNESSITGLDGALQSALSQSPLLSPSSSSAFSVTFEDVRMKSCDFYCRCTTEQFIFKMKSLPIQNLVELLGDLRASTKTDPTLDLTCHHCNKKHPLTEQDIEDMLT